MDANRVVNRRRGVALVPAILIVAGLAVFVVALMTTVLSGNRTVVHQGEEYQVSSAVESVAILGVEKLWSTYVSAQGGAAGDIRSFRDFLNTVGIPDDGPGGPPPATAGKDLLPFLALPEENARPRFNDVNVDAVQVVRRDVADATQLFLTVSASTTRGEGIVDPVLNRAVQQVYTVEPADFPGFEYALLANNVNCIFCHTSIDGAERWWNRNPALAGTFDRVKAGTLESLLLRHDADGLGTMTDGDADSFLAGTLYVRGETAETDGVPIDDFTEWAAQSFLSHPFDGEGHLLEDANGLFPGEPFEAADSPMDPFANLYSQYPTDFAQQGDGYLPEHFPSPFPDDGGIDPSTGQPIPGAADNRIVDDSEFEAVADDALGWLTAGVVNVTESDEVIDTPLDYANAVFTGNTDTQSIQGTIGGNVVLTGWPDNPIGISGTLAVDGDLIIQGVVRGEGAIYVRGNIYIPTDLYYADGKTYQDGDPEGQPSGPRTFGIHQDGTKNALALTCGGNIVIGDYQRPATTRPDGTHVEPGEFDIISGNPDTGNVMIDDWSFPLAEIALFNRGEWSKTQQYLPGENGQLVQNSGYVPHYTPRYYGYGEDTIIPIFNKGPQYFDPAKGTWLGLEAPIGWDPNLLTYADPNNPTDPFLFKPNGQPKAVTSALSPTGGWMSPEVYKMSVEYFEDLRPRNTPMNLDALLYTNNAIFTIIHRASSFAGMMILNGGLVAADVGMLAPGKYDPRDRFANHSPLSEYAIGLQLNYDKRLKNSLRITNPFQVQLKRTYWNPTANLL
jgi:hypothetical protein